MCLHHRGRRNTTPRAHNERVNALQRHIGILCGADVVSMSAISGGDVADAFRVELNDGRRVFAKTKRNAPAGFFSTEARGLRWLAEPDVLPVADVVASSDDPLPCLVLEWIDVGGPGTETGEREFGAGLARLHLSGAPHFGREDGATTGSTRDRRPPSASSAT